MIDQMVVIISRDTASIQLGYLTRVIANFLKKEILNQIVLIRQVANVYTHGALKIFHKTVLPSLVATRKFSFTLAFVFASGGDLPSTGTSVRSTSLSANTKNAFS